MVWVLVSLALLVAYFFTKEPVHILASGIFAVATSLGVIASNIKKR